MLKQAAFSALAGLLLVVPPAAGEPLRVATIDVNQVLNELPESKTKKAELDKVSQKAKQEIDKRRSRVQALEAKAKQQGAPADAEDQLRAAIRDYERTVSDSEEDLKREFLKINRELTGKVMQAVKAYASKNKIDLVLDKSAKGIGPVLYGTPAADITDEVLKEISR